jgi:CelD/BcsL family acetyltransferase involved in cellulose biosynthesis
MTAAQIDLTKGWDAYWSSRKSHWRNNVRRSERKLRERGRVSYLRYRPRGRALGDGAPRWDLYNACERLAENSWQGTSTSGTTLSHTVVRSFFRDAHARAAEAGTLDLNLLLVDDVPAAFSYNYHFNGQVTGLRMGFDHAVAREGAGVVLQYLTLKDSFARGDQLYDLGTEYLECKRYWQTSHVETQRCTYYAPLSLRGQAMRLRRGLQAWWGNQRTSKSAVKAS